MQRTNGSEVVCQWDRFWNEIKYHANAGIQTVHNIVNNNIYSAPNIV